MNQTTTNTQNNYSLYQKNQEFAPLTSNDLLEILGLTIKQDDANKIVTFLCQLSAYSEDAQFNISYNAASSTGKSYIPNEIARLFPEEDVLQLAYCSPTAFFHDVGEWNKETKEYLVDLSRKILIFLDQPHNDLLSRLRPLLSHDKKEIKLKITDKSQKLGLRTKNVLLRGYPSVIFCTAGLRIDEQEATRFLLLSPEINQEKIRQGIIEGMKKEADSGKYGSIIDKDQNRTLLKRRIAEIKAKNIQEIRIENSEKVFKRFLGKNKILKPRHQRDIKRLAAIIKSFALLNLWWREKENGIISANQEDIDEAFKIWDLISESQELSLPPYIFDLYKQIILPAWNDKNLNYDGGCTGMLEPMGLSRQELLQKHYQAYGKMLDIHQLRQQILPMLETAGLIFQEPDPTDKRRMMVHLAVSPAFDEKKNSEEGWGKEGPESG